MKTRERRGRPLKGASALTERFELRMTKEERQAFEDAAELAGLDLSAWLRARMRIAARKELTQARRPVAFMAAVRKN